jgi:acetyl esterase/lipase
LQWRIFAPQNSGSGPWPAILLIHGGGFSEGDPVGGAIETIAKQLADDGYYVAIPTYRLAPWGLITGQPCHDDDPDLSGRPPEQSDDIKAEVIALRNDSHCNGKVGAVGGSGGGSWAVWVALDTEPSGDVYPFWHSTDRVDCAVGISGAYQFDDRTSEDYGNDVVPKFAGNIENYTGTDIPSEQHSVSPVTLVASSARPVFLINSIHDFMPYHQIVDMICALEDAGLSEANGDFKALTIPGNGHSFDNWFHWDGIVPVGSDPTRTAGTDAIAFLDAHLK